MKEQFKLRACASLLHLASVILLGLVPLPGGGQVHVAPEQLSIVGADFGGDVLQLFGGNVLLKGSSEPAIRLQHDGVLGVAADSPVNPLFHMGRIQLGGDGSPNFRFLYQDDGPFLDERLVFQFDSKGIVASAKPDRGSHFEGFINNQCEPLFRLNSYPDMRFELGEGALRPVDVVVSRSGPGTLSIISTTNAGTFDSECRVLSAGIPSGERLRITAQNVSETEDITVVRVIDGYLQLDLSSGPPPAEDCTGQEHFGRMQVDPTTQELWICVQGGGALVRGWRSRAAGVPCVGLRSRHDSVGRQEGGIGRSAGLLKGPSWQLPSRSGVSSLAL